MLRRVISQLLFGDLSQSEILSEIKQPLVSILVSKFEPTIEDLGTHKIGKKANCMNLEIYLGKN